METPLENKIEELVNRTKTLEYAMSNMDGESEMKLLMQELASWVVQTVMPNREQLEDDLYGYDWYPRSKDQAEMVIQTINN